MKLTKLNSFLLVLFIVFSIFFLSLSIYVKYYDGPKFLITNDIKTIDKKFRLVKENIPTEISEQLKNEYLGERKQRITLVSDSSEVNNHFLDNNKDIISGYSISDEKGVLYIKIFLSPKVTLNEAKRSINHMYYSALLFHLESKKLKPDYSAAANNALRAIEASDQENLYPIL